MHDSVKGEITYWKNRCLALERRVEKMESDAPQTESAHDSNMKEKENEESEIINVKKELKEVNNAFSKLDKKWSARYQKLSEEIQKDRQYSRLNNILIHGYKSLPFLSDIDFIKATVLELNKLFPSFKGFINASHIDDAHPYATVKSSPKKVVIIKFANRWLKKEIIKRQNELLGTGLYVTEHLTPYTQELLASAKNLVGPTNAWVSNTIVTANYYGSQFHIRCAENLDELSSMINNNSNSTSNHQSTNGNCPAPIAQHCPTPSVQPIQPVQTLPLTESNAIPLGTNESQSSNNCEQNHPALFNTLLFQNKNLVNKSSALRGRPSRNGRGRGGYNYYYRGRTGNFYS